MSNHKNSFDHSEIQILECGVNWMVEAGEKWYQRLFQLLADKSQGTHGFLRLTDPVEFGKNLTQYLRAVLEELRSFGRVQTAFDDLWPDHIGMMLSPLDKRESIKVGEVFLRAFSELAEEAWSPVMEETWRKTVKAILESCVRSPEISPRTRHAHSCMLAV